MLRAVAVALAATSFALATSPAPSPFDNPAFVRSAIVMRHCVRSTNLVLANGSLPTKPDAPAPMDEFANSSFPSWPPDSLPKLCLDEGELGPDQLAAMPGVCCAFPFLRATDTDL